MHFREDYYRDTVLTYEADEIQKSGERNSGRSPRSILGLGFLKALLGCLLQIEMTNSSLRVCYVDNAVAVITVRTIELVQTRLTQVIRRVYIWSRMMEHGPLLVLGQTEIQPITGKWIDRNVIMN